MTEQLNKYDARRDFDRTPEPGPESPEEDHPGAPRFVVQEHEAQQHHYDFRLEVDGVLASWVVPKGPSSDPSERRLALRMEDHPLDYADFEGKIPKGEYGAGTVEIWDQGTFRNMTREGSDSVPAPKALEQGHLVVRLEGKKLNGGYALQRVELEDDDEERWLLVKTKDDKKN